MPVSSSDVLEILLFQSGYNTNIVMIGVSLLGLASGVAGVFVLLRERSMVSDAVAHCTLPGLALMFLLLYSLQIERSFELLLLGALVSGAFGLVLVHFLSHFTRLAEETCIGAVLSVFFGFGVVLLSIIQSLGSSGSAGLSHFIYGHTASMLGADATRLVAVNIATFAISLLLFKEFRLICFDREFARVQGWSTNILDLVMLALLLVVVVVGLQSVGMLLIIAMLIIPATAARFWTNSLRNMLIISSLIGALSGYLGAAMSALLPNLPTGAVIVLCAGFFFIASFLVAPNRGLLSGLFRGVATRMRILREHLLREFYEEAERTGQKDLSSFSMIAPSFGRLWLLLPFFSKYVRVAAPNSIALTPAGVDLAVTLTRNHRLWELYMMEYAGISSSHVDYSADIAEHVLSRKIIKKLESHLSAAGTLPGVIDSAHPIGADK